MPANRSKYRRGNTKSGVLPEELVDFCIRLKVQIHFDKKTYGQPLKMLRDQKLTANNDQMHRNFVDIKGKKKWIMFVYGHLVDGMSNDYLLGSLWQQYRKNRRQFLVKDVRCINWE
jgi:hypothetical protein